MREGKKEEKVEDMKEEKRGQRGVWEKILES